MHWSQLMLMISEYLSLFRNALKTGLCDSLAARVKVSKVTQMCGWVLTESEIRWRQGNMVPEISSDQTLLFTNEVLSWRSDLSSFRSIQLTFVHSEAKLPTLTEHGQVGQVSLNLLTNCLFVAVTRTNCPQYKERLSAMVMVIVIVMAMVMVKKKQKSVCLFVFTALQA